MEHAATLGEFVAGRGRKVTLRAGQVLFHEGDASTCVYACVSGRLNLFITTPTGRDVMLGIKVPTQAFGELSAIDGAPRSASAVAMEPTVIAQLSGDEFLDGLTHVPTLSLAVLRELSGYLRLVNARVSARSSENTTERVGHLLIELAAKFHRHAATQGRTELPVTQDEVAAWVGSTREATARSLAALRRCGVVETGRNRIIVLDTIALAATIRNLPSGAESGAARVERVGVGAAVHVGV